MISLGTVFAIASSLFGVYAQNKALEEQGRANLQTAKNMITSMNYSMQNLEQERADAFEAPVQELERTQLQGRRLSTAVEAAINEGITGGGRTAHLLARASRADTYRAMSSVKDNYKKKSNEIDLNKEATLLNAKQQIGSIQDIKKPSLLGTLMQLGTGYLAAKSQAETIDLIRTQAGLGRNSTYGSGNINSAPRMHWETQTNSFVYNIPSYRDMSATKFTFGYINPFTQNTQTTNYF